MFYEVEGQHLYCNAGDWVKVNGAVLVVVAAAVVSPLNYFAFAVVVVEMINVVVVGDFGDVVPSLDKPECHLQSMMMVVVD